MQKVALCVIIPVTLKTNTLANISSMSHNAISQNLKWLVVTTKDLKEVTKWSVVACMQRNLQYHTMNLLSIIDSLLSNTIYFDMHIQLLVTNGELLLEL